MSSTWGTGSRVSGVAKSDSGWPSTYSSTRYGGSASSSASSRRTMLGWRRRPDSAASLRSSLR